MNKNKHFFGDPKNKRVNKPPHVQNCLNISGHLGPKPSDHYGVSWSKTFSCW